MQSFKNVHMLTIHTDRPTSKGQLRGLCCEARRISVRGSHSKNISTRNWRHPSTSGRSKACRRRIPESGGSTSSQWWGSARSPHLSRASQMNRLMDVSRLWLRKWTFLSSLRQPACRHWQLTAPSSKRTSPISRTNAWFGLRRWNAGWWDSKSTKLQDEMGSQHGSCETLHRT